MPVKVSVVVPVYNPGAHLKYCVDSIIRQSLPDDEYEAIFVDDGSTDGTAQRLDALAAAHPNIQVIHIPNSGWPGRPRNVGTDAATGRYVMYVDNDDALGARALERMYAFAEEHDLQVVIGRYAGHHRRVAREIFRRTWTRATLEQTTLMDTLTPHKMFRRDFLIEHGLRFPEGRVRLEDHLVVVRAYLEAERIGVYSDYICYYHIRRDDNSNAAFTFEPKGYYTYVRQVMDVIEAGTPEGSDLRDKMMRRYLRTEMLSRLDGRTFLDYPDDFRKEVFEEVHRLYQERITPGVPVELPPAYRVRAEVLRQGDLAELMAAVSFDVGTVPKTALTSLGWEGDELVMGFGARMVTATGEPMTFVRHDGRLHLDVPPHWTDATVPWEVREVDEALEASTLDILVRRREDSAEFFVPTTFTAFREEIDADRIALRYTGEARLDPKLVGEGSPLWTGTWDLYVLLRTVGLDKQARLGADRGPTMPSNIGSRRISAAHVAEAYWTVPQHNLSIKIIKSPTVWRRLKNRIRRELWRVWPEQRRS